MKSRGKLEIVKKHIGLSEDLELIVDGEKFYKTTRDFDFEPKEYLEKQVEVEYDLKKLSWIMWWFEKIVLISYGIPREYKQIEKISLVEN